MARRGDHTLEQIKEMVLIAAEDLIVKEGLPQLTIRKIAAKIGYTVGSIYMVFEGMNDLILHIKGKILDTLTEQIEQIETGKAEQRLQEMAGIYVRFASQNLNRWSMIFEHRLPKEVTIPNWYQKKLDNLYGAFETQFTMLAPDLSPSQRKQTALAFLGSIHGICILMLTSQSTGLKESDLGAITKLLVSQFVQSAVFSK